MAQSERNADTNPGQQDTRPAGGTQGVDVVSASGGKVPAARPAPMRTMVPGGSRKRLQRRAVLTREMVDTRPRARWIESGPESEIWASGFILKLEERLFGNFDASERAWKRPAAESKEQREWPLPPARTRGELRGRPQPTPRPMAPPLRKRS